MTPKDYLILIKDGSRSIFYSEKVRLPKLKDGIQNRYRQLYNEYHALDISFDMDDVIIDIGANVGEFPLTLNFFHPSLGLKYYCFEPEPRAFRALQLNNPTQNNFNLAIGLDNGVLDFYISSRGASSSLIIPYGSSTTQKTEVRTLDWCWENILKCKTDIKLLKIDAEGFEPEVLVSGQKLLDNVKFCSIDLGPERGKLKLRTFNQANLLLRDCGFELIKSGDTREVYLYSRLLR